MITVSVQGFVWASEEQWMASALWSLKLLGKSSNQVSIQIKQNCNCDRCHEGRTKKVLTEEVGWEMMWSDFQTEKDLYAFSIENKL